MKYFAIAAVALAFTSNLPATAEVMTSPEKADYVRVEGDPGKDGKIIKIWSFTYDNDKVGHLLSTFCDGEEKVFISTPGVLSSNRDCDGVRIDADAIVKKLNG